MPTTIAAGIVGGGAAHQLRIAQRGGAEHDPVDAESQPVIDRGAVADAAAELDAQIDRLADRPHRVAIDRLAGKGAVEIDDMQPRETRLRRMPRACAAGSSLNTVALAISPRTRRTQAPPFRSIAGNRITRASLAGPALAGSSRRL